MYKGYRGALSLIYAIGVDYDGMDESVESMRDLVDELVGIASTCLEYGDDYDGLSKDYIE